MKKLIVVSAILLTVATYAQESVLTAGDLPLPASWKENALIVLTVNFVLGLAAYGVKKIPGKIGTVISSIIDLFSANVKHTEKK